jgi:hypothetical protein
MKFINGNIYSHGRLKISNLLNRVLHEIVGVTSPIKLNFLFGIVNIYMLLDELTPKLIL